MSKLRRIIYSLLLFTPLRVIAFIIHAIRDKRLYKSELILLLFSMVFITPTAPGVMNESAVIKQIGMTLGALPIETTKVEQEDVITDNNKFQGQETSNMIFFGEVPKEYEDMYKEYIALSTEVAKKYNVPRWLILGINMTEAGLYTEVPLIGAGAHYKDEYGKPLSNGKKVSYKDFGVKTNTGYKMAADTDGDIQGPFQFEMGASWGSDYIVDKELNLPPGTADITNWYISAQLIALQSRRRMDDIKATFPNMTDDELALWAACYHNMGSGGCPGSFGRENFEYITKNYYGKVLYDDHVRDDLSKWSNAKAMDYLFEWGAIPSPQMMNSSVLDTKLKYTGPTRDIPGVYRTEYNSTGTKYKGPGQGAGIEKGWGHFPNKFKVGSVSFPAKEKGRYSVVYWEGAQYMLKVAAYGRTADMQMNGYMRGGSGPASVPDVFKPIQNNLPTGNTPTYEKYPFDDLAIGYKNGFPIYQQINREGFPYGSSPLNNIGYNYNGSSTNLMRAGCSIMALTSIIHGLGYGNKDIPSRPGVKPTLSNLVKILPNGPATGAHMASLGYKIEQIPIGSKAGFDNLYSKLLKGTPFVVNVQGAALSMYDKTGKEVEKGSLTWGGHILIFQRAQTMNGKRFVELVNTNRLGTGILNGSASPGTYSTKHDSNNIYYDFDEMIQKGAISGMIPYTIAGAQLPSYSGSSANVTKVISPQNRQSQSQQVPGQGSNLKEPTQEQINQATLSTYESLFYRMTGTTLNKGYKPLPGVQVIAQQDISRLNVVEVGDAQRIVIPFETNKQVGIVITFLNNQHPLNTDIKMGDIIGVTSESSEVKLATLINNKWTLANTSGITEDSR